MRYKIGAVSDKTGLSPATLRLWEAEYGLLQPIRSPGGTRLYSAGDIERVLFIRDLIRSAGYSLHGVAGLLEAGTARADLTGQTLQGSATPPADGGLVSAVFSVLARMADSSSLSQAASVLLEGVCELTDARRARLRLFWADDAPVERSFASTGPEGGTPPRPELDQRLAANLCCSEPVLIGSDVVGMLLAEVDLGARNITSVQRILGLTRPAGVILGYFMFRERAKAVG